MKYRYILFDMDGTVLDTLDDLCDSVNVALERFSMPLISAADCRRYLGNGAGRLIARSVPEGTPEETVKRVLDFYVPWYAEHSMVKTAPYPGIIPLLERIAAAGGHSAIVTNKPDVASRLLTDRFFSGLVEASIGQSDRIARKPAPDTIFEAMRVMGASADECVYIGDSEVDILTARNAGIPCISVLWGFRSAEELEAAGAQTFAADTGELFDLL